MNMENRRLLSCLWSGFIVSLALSSCASGPPLAVAEGEFAYLAGGGLVYFYVDVGLARPILENVSIRGLDMTRSGRFLDKVDFLAGAVYPGGAPQHLLIHAWRQKGKVPGVSALFFSAKWKKAASPTGRNYYHSDQYGLSVSTMGSHAFVSDADPFAFEPAVAAPGGLAELRWESLMLGWLDNAGTPINRFLSTAGIPMRIPTERILFGVCRSVDVDADMEAAEGLEEAGPVYQVAEDGGPLYELRLLVETENENQAKALAALLAFVRVFVENPELNVDPEYLAALRPLLANPPSQVGSDLAIHTDPMSAGEIALLFNRFAVYSQQTTL
jgi:hypothetical protein